MRVTIIATHQTLGSVVSTGPLLPSAWDDWHVSEWTLWGLESSLAGRTKAWLDIQAQNARAKVKKSDRQTDTVVYMSSRGAAYVVSGHSSPSSTLALWFRKHQAWCSHYGQGSVCGARPLPMSGYGPENSRKRPLCTLLWTGLCVCWGALLRRIDLDSPSSCPTPCSPSGFPGPSLAKPVGLGD